jgi:ribosomal protein L13E
MPIDHQDDRGRCIADIPVFSVKPGNIMTKPVSRHDVLRCTSRRRAAHPAGQLVRPADRKTISPKRCKRPASSATPIRLWQIGNGNCLDSIKKAGLGRLHARKIAYLAGLNRL